MWSFYSRLKEGQQRRHEWLFNSKCSHVSHLTSTFPLGNVPVSQKVLLCFCMCTACWCMSIVCASPATRWMVQFCFHPSFQGLFFFFFNFLELFFLLEVHQELVPSHHAGQAAATFKNRAVSPSHPTQELLRMPWEIEASPCLAAVKIPLPQRRFLIVEHSLGCFLPVF